MEITEDKLKELSQQVGGIPLLPPYPKQRQASYRHIIDQFEKCKRYEPWYSGTGLSASAIGFWLRSQDRPFEIAWEKTPGYKGWTLTEINPDAY